METFAKRLQQLRKRRRVPKKTLSELCGLSPSVISKYEQGERQPKLETLILLADYFDTSIDYLVGETEYTGRYPKK